MAVAGVGIALALLSGFFALVLLVGGVCSVHKLYRDHRLRRAAAAQRIELEARGPECLPSYGDALTVDDPMLFIRASPFPPTYAASAP